jgi:phage-related baseplate assembly protein
MITTLDGVTVSYGTDMLGQDDELDPALRQRCRDALGRASPNGPAAAYDYFAKSTLRPDGTNVGVTRTRRIESNGTVRSYVADADGVIVSGDVAYIQSTVDLNCVPTGFTAIVESAATLAVPLEISLTRAPGTTDEQAEVAARVTAAIAEYFSTIPVGGDDAASFRGIYISTLITIIRVAAGPGVVNAVVTLPAADVALAVNQVPIISGAPSYSWD